MSIPKDYEDILRRQSGEDLLKIILSANDYEEAAIALCWKEIYRRGGLSAICDSPELIAKLEKGQPQKPDMPKISISTNSNQQSTSIEHKNIPKIVICPICGKDDKIQKVSAVVSTNQHSGSSSGSSVGVTYDGDFAVTEAYTNLNTNSISELAKALSPPDEPPKPLEDGCLHTILVLVGIFFGLPFIGGLIISASLGLRYGKYDLLVVPTIVFLGSLWWLISRAITKEQREARKKEARDKINANYQTAKLAWDNAISKWKRSYYCHRDGLVFDPATNEHSQPEALQHYLFNK